MKTELRNVYSCDHCRKKYVLKHMCESHEVKCKKNPANFRACFDCQLCVKQTHTMYYDMWDGSEQSREVDVLACTALNKLVYPPIVDLKGNYPYEFGDIINEPMPVECQHKKVY